MPRMKKYRAIHNVAVAKRSKLVKGSFLDAQDPTLWHEAEDLEVPPGTTLKSGSIFERALTSRDEKLLKRLGAIDDAESGLHLNLESVSGFETDVPFVYGRNGRSTIADVLRAHQIMSLEQVASNASGGIPFLEMFGESADIPVRTILSVYGDPEDVNRWVHQAEELVGTSNATEVIPQVTEDVEGSEASSVDNTAVEDHNG